MAGDAGGRDTSKSLLARTVLVPSSVVTVRRAVGVSG